jgi:hypothetical protein
MPFVLLAFGILFLVIAWQGTQQDLFALLKSEFVGKNSFLVWIAAILILGLAGYIKPIRPVTHAFMVLILIVLVLANGGKVFANFNAAIRAPTAPGGQSGAQTGVGDLASTPITPTAASDASNPLTYGLSSLTPQSAMQG